jgi:hypothetical protein
MRGVQVEMSKTFQAVKMQSLLMVNTLHRTQQQASDGSAMWTSNRFTYAAAIAAVYVYNRSFYDRQRGRWCRGY